jgi:hypothetical protein
MKFKEVIAVKGFWRSVIILGILFLIIYNGIDLVFSYEFSIDKFIEEKLSDRLMLRFIISNILGGFAYGFIVTFLQFRSKLKKQKENQH